MKRDSNNIRFDSFWVYQISGWLLFYAADVVLMLYVRSRDMRGFIEESIEDLAGFLLTLVLRSIYRRIKHQQISLPSLLMRIIASTIICAATHYAIVIGLVYSILTPERASAMIDPSWILRWTFWLAPIYFGWSVLYFGIKFWIDWQQQRTRAQNADFLAQQAQLQMLRYQVNPHFLFNTLNSIRGLMLEDSSKAKSMITELSEFLRYSLMSSDRSEVPLRDEINTVRHYLAIQQKRFEDKLQVSIDIHSAAESRLICSFLIHPLVENAIKYGMQTSPMPLRITIKAIYQDNALRISIVNTGKWIEPTKTENHESTGTGIENVVARLDNVFPGRYTFCTSEHDGAVHVTLEIADSTGTEQYHNIFTQQPVPTV
jgi:two-component system, LytTR family, sensor kinase